MIIRKNNVELLSKIQEMALYYGETEIVDLLEEQINELESVAVSVCWTKDDILKAIENCGNPFGAVDEDLFKEIIDQLVVLEGDDLLGQAIQRVLFNRREKEWNRQAVHVELVPKKTELGISADDTYEMLFDGNPIGICGVSDDIDGGIFLEWIEIFDSFRGKGLFRSCLSAVSLYYKVNDIHFECESNLHDMYLHLHAQDLSYDTFREVYDMTIHTY